LCSGFCSRLMMTMADHRSAGRYQMIAACDAHDHMRYGSYRRNTSPDHMAYLHRVCDPVGFERTGKMRFDLTACSAFILGRKLYADSIGAVALGTGG